MANLASHAITSAIRDVVENGHGNTRTIPSGTYGDGGFEALGIEAESMHAMVKPAAEPRITKMSRNKHSPPQPGSVVLYDLEVEVRLVRHINLEHMTKEEVRDQTLGLADRDGDILCQGLCYPDNIATDAEGTPTGLVSGMLVYKGSKIGKIDAKTAGNVITIHTFTAVACVTLGSTAAQVFDVLLLQDGFEILLETSDGILIES